MNAETKTTVIRRYSNRKLYDLSLSRYVTVRELTDRIRRREEFRVEDYSGTNVTGDVLAQIVVLNSRELRENSIRSFLEQHLSL